MVDLKNPDFQRFPRVRKALDAAVVVDLEPGDAVYYPSMWWHQVEALDPFNIMINFWWLTSPAYMGNPLDIVTHAILGLRDRSEAEKKAWREVLITMYLAHRIRRGSIFPRLYKAHWRNLMTIRLDASEPL